jgi:hypothetical protein
MFQIQGIVVENVLVIHLKDKYCNAQQTNFVGVEVGGRVGGQNSGGGGGDTGGPYLKKPKTYCIKTKAMKRHIKNKISSCRDLTKVISILN